MSQQSFHPDDSVLAAELVDAGIDTIDAVSDTDSHALPAANQAANQETAISTPVDPQHTAQLARFNLRLVDHPRILLCTLDSCCPQLPLIPDFKHVTAHIKKVHKKPLVGSAKEMLRSLLDELDVPSPGTVCINKDLLPERMIPELGELFQGYRCNLCSYAVQAKSAFYEHLRGHPDAKGRASYTHPVPMQKLHECGKKIRYLHVRNQDLDPTPPPAILTTALDASTISANIKTKVDAFLKQNEDCLREADLLKPGIQPESASGNIGPWAKQLGWHAYWAGKPIVAIGALSKSKKVWPGAHIDFVHWVLVMTQQAAATWMTAFLKTGRQVQQTFRAYSPEPSQPYNLSLPTVKKRADMWAFLLALLIHAVFDGVSFGYYGDSDQTEHLGLSAHLDSVLQDLHDLYYGADADIDPLTDEDLASKAVPLLLQLSHLLVTQQPEVYGENDKLALVRLFLHLCVSADGTPIPVNAATSIIASLEFCCRAVLWQWLLDPEDGVLIERSAEEIAAEVDLQMKRYLYSTSSSASSYLQSLHRYGTVLAQDDGTNFHFSWQQDLKSVKFGTETIQVDRLQALMHGAQKRAEALLRQLCLLPEDASLALNLKHILDDHRNMQPDFSFVAASPELQSISSVLCRAAAGNVPAAQPLMDPYSDELEFDADAANAYFSMHNEFTKLLAVLIELGSGLPARGTELLQLQHTNTLVGPRNLFVHDGSVFTALPSKKGTGRQKVIPRFLPYPVGCMVVFYVAQVVPFVHLLHNAVLQPRAASSMLLVDHHGNAWETNAVTKMLQALCQEHISSITAGLNMRTWRQLAVSIDRKLIRPRSMTAEEVLDSAHDLQAGHSTQTAEQHYGLDASMLHQLTQESMDVMLEVSERWHAFWGMPSRFEEDVKPYDHLMAGKAAGDDCKAVSSLKRQLDALQEDMRCVKQRLEHPIEVAPPSATSAVPAAPISRSAVLAEPVSNALFKVTGSHRTKTLEQAYALNAIYAKETPLIIVMATGSGKSALFMAPLHWLPPASVIIVVVPFIALTDDLMEQCQWVGIVASKWTGYRSADRVEGSQLVFVAAENCYSQAFANWAQELDQQKRLAAIFFDECHVCVTQNTFRPAMEKIKALISAVRVQQYFLTATLPPTLVPTFKTTLCLPQDGTGMIRAATNRKNISYKVQQLTSSVEMPFQIKRLLEAHPAGAVMIFCKSTTAAQTTAEDLNCTCVIADMPEEQKQRTVSTWLRCSATETNTGKRVIVGTTAIGTGINPQHVSLVVHCGDTWDMVSYVQESGRAGRSGSGASAVLLATRVQTREAQVQLYIEERTCRRLAISRYLDGMPVTCLSQPDFALCDLCQQRVEGPVTPPKKIIGLESPPESDKRERQQNGKTQTAGQLQAANSSSRRLQVSTTALDSPTPRQRRHQGFTAALDLNHQHSASRGAPNQILSSTAQNQLQPALPVLSFTPPPFAFSLSPSPAHPPVHIDIDTSSSRSLLQSLAGVCSLCYLFRNQHTCSGQHGIRHSFSNCNCWPQIKDKLPQSEPRINATYIGGLKRRMQKAKHIACYACLVPINICANTSSTNSTACSRRYADIVLPVVAAVLRCREHTANVLRLIGLDQMDPHAVVVQGELGTAVTYKGESMLLAFAMFAAAVEAAAM
ncbi:uncharacterized protein UTRI_00931 [Ustilago trichophora]|uniref:DNA 3'-5' helicase n=1 Tax=Ustilago trichophora TaxID=86804 RepID=A0A5C3DV07_9BASI|nr:uncharacterized protein UTRI_00931 [Ustilago trichophora]